MRLNKFLICIPLSILVIIFIFLFCSSMQDYSSVYGEGYNMPYYHFTYLKFLPDCFFKELISHSDHCWYLFSAVYVILEKYVPQFLNMHPQDAVIITAKTVLFPIFIVFLTVLTNGFLKYSKDKTLFPLVLLFSFIITVQSLFYVDFLWVFINRCWFLAYIFNPLFAVALLNLLEYYYVDNVVLTKNKKIALIILSCITAIGHEYFKFLFLIMLPLLYIFHHKCFKEPVYIKSFLKYSGIYLIIVFLSLLNNLNPDYFGWLHQHTFTSYTRTIDLLLCKKELFQDFISIIIVNEIYIYIIIFLLIGLILIFVKDKEKNKRFVIYISACLLSSLIFFLSLLLLAPKHYDTLSSIYNQTGLLFLLRITLISVIFSCLGYIYSNTKKIFWFTFIPIFLLFSNAFISNVRYNWIKYINSYKEIRTIQYIFEKSYIINNILNKSNVYYVYDSSIPDDYILYMNNTYKTDSDIESYTIKRVCKRDTLYQEVKNKMLENSKNNIGYIFTKEELENPDFSSLYDLVKNNKQSE